MCHFTLYTWFVSFVSWRYFLLYEDCMNPSILTKSYDRKLFDKGISIHVKRKFLLNLSNLDAKLSTEYMDQTATVLCRFRNCSFTSRKWSLLFKRNNWRLPRFFKHVAKKERKKQTFFKTVTFTHTHSPLVSTNKDPDSEISIFESARFYGSQHTLRRARIKINIELI